MGILVTKSYSHASDSRDVHIDVLLHFVATKSSKISLGPEKSCFQENGLNLCMNRCSYRQSTEQ